MKLIHRILGHDTDDLLDILTELAPEIGVRHIAYVRMGSNKSLDATLLASTVTYPKQWQRRYFTKQYFLMDPVLQYAINTSLHHFDWEEAGGGSAAVQDFFSDAARHDVGSHGISIVVRNRRNTYAIVSFTSNMTQPDWERFKTASLDALYHASALIDAAAMAGSKLPDLPDVNLSLREEQCLVWAARGKTYEEIAEILNLSFHSVRSHLDVARHKLRGANLTNTVALALTLGVIPPQALRDSL